MVAASIVSEIQTSGSGLKLGRGIGRGPGEIAVHERFRGLGGALGALPFLRLGEKLAVARDVARQAIEPQAAGVAEVERERPRQAGMLNRELARLRVVGDLSASRL